MNRYNGFKTFIGTPRSPTHASEARHASRQRSGGGEVGGCKNECESVAVGDGECSLLAAYMRDARRD